MARRQARAAAMQMVYENMLGGDGGEDTLQGLIGFEADEEDRAYLDSVVNGVAQNASRLDETICKYLKDWSLDRIARVDRAVMRLAIYELIHTPEVPGNVVISEAVALAQKDGTPEGGRFVTGVLSSELRDRDGQA